jgi:hypothetical protein
MAGSQSERALSCHCKTGTGTFQYERTPQRIRKLWLRKVSHYPSTISLNIPRLTILDGPPIWQIFVLRMAFSSPKPIHTVFLLNSAYHSAKPSLGHIQRSAREVWITARRTQRVLDFVRCSKERMPS